MPPALNLPPPSHSTDDTLAASSSKPTPTPKFSSGGIIYPPPELRRTIDKAAELIAKKDPAFEESIKQSESNNPKFTFLKEDDAYHAYYVSRRDAVRRGESSASLSADQASSSAQFDAAAAQQQQSSSSSATLLAQQDKPPQAPEPFEFSADLPNITAIDLDVLKLTALFTARKGRSFASGLLARENKSFQFEFLRPSHSLFPYFNLLVEQYQKVISPSATLLGKVKIGAYGTSEPDDAATTKKLTGPGRGGARPVLLEQIKKRAEYEKYAREQRKKANQEQEKEKAAFDEIDWQDFVVVGTVELTETDQHIDLPPPKSLREMESMTLAQKKMASMIMETSANGHDDDEQIEEVQMPTSRPVGSTASSSGGATEEIRQTPTGQGIKVRKDYVPRGLASRVRGGAGGVGGGGAATTKCPVCGETVLIDEMAEHVRFELLNPQYREQRKELESKKASQAALQAGADPTYYLKQLAASTSRAQAQEDEETRQKREAEERRLAKEKEKIIWDGHAKSRSTARELIQKNKQLEQEMNKLNQKPVVVLPEYGPSFPPTAHDGDAAQTQTKEETEQTTGKAESNTIMFDANGNSVAVGEAVVDGENASASTPVLAGTKRPAEEAAPGERASRRVASGAAPALATPDEAKLAKKDDGTLWSEAEWLSSHFSTTPTITLKLTIHDDPTSASLREESYEASLKSTIATLRDYIHQDLLNSKVAASKIKVRINGKPTTLKQSLAHWNLMNGDEVDVFVNQ